MAQVKVQIKAPEIIQLSNEETANSSDAQFKTLVTKRLTEMVEYGRRIEEIVKAMQSEIKKNIQETNGDGKETRTQINSLEQKAEINSHPEQNEETRIQKNEERLRNLCQQLQWSSIHIIGVTEGEEEEQEIEAYFNK